MPSIALPVSLRGQLLSGTRKFSPASLFSANEPGVWFDPSDLTTLFQDPAGTTPVTAPGNTVGLMLDKSKGLVLGAELVVNGDFSNPVTTGWTATGGTISVVDGWLRLTSNTTLSFTGYSFPTVVGATYRVNSQWRSSAGSWRMLIGTSNGGNQIAAATSAGSGSLSVLFQATTTTTWVSVRSVSITSGDLVEIDNISVRELAGNHATQATLASRPNYGIEPVGGRRNLLTQTENFSSADWSKTDLTVSGNQVSYVGGLVGTKECVQLVSVPGGTASKVLTAYVTVSGSGKFRLKNTHSAVQDNFSANVTATGSRQTIALTVTNSSSAGNGLQAISIINSTDNAAFSLTVHEFQLELSSTATNYQRVTTQYDVTEAGVASTSYLAFDGVDDGMVTGTITPGVDKVQVFAGVRKLSDAATGMIVESSADAGSNNGAFRFLVPGAAGYEYRQRGTLNAAGAAVSSGYASPITNVLTGLGDIGGDLATLRVNGTQVAQSTADQGTGNFLAYPLYIGRRGGSILPYSGRIYSLITRFGANLDAGVITNTETWVAGKTGISLAPPETPNILTRSGDTILDRANSIIERRTV